jgi:CRISPR-associated protein Csd1
MTILSSLSRAYDRLPDAPPFGYSAEKISFVIGLNADGSVASVTDLRSQDRGKKVPRLMRVPASFKRPGTTPRAFLLWDKTSFALGVTAKPGDRTMREHGAFVERQEEVFGHSEDPGLRALLAFLDRWSPETYAAPLWPDDLKDTNLVFALESERLRNIYLHDRPAARALVETQTGSDDASSSMCLVTGEFAPVARLHPAIKGVWGGQTAGGSIVSFNLDAFRSYGHDQGDNAPVSEAAAFKYTTALNTFLAGRTNRIQIGDASTVFWADSADAAVAKEMEAAFLAMYDEVPEIDDSAQAQKIGAVLERIRQGRPWDDVDPHLDAGVRFHVLGLAPNAARIAIRFWFDNDFGTLARNYRLFADEMRIAPPPRDEYPPLRRYLGETAVLGKRENVVPTLAGDWMRAILAGTSYPLTLLSTVLMRIRADGEVNALRAGMLKAVLMRNFTREVPVALDPDYTDKGYLLGRLFAAYEQAQSAALGRNVNTTIKDKFYGAASATPRKVFSLLDRNSANHLSTVGKERPGQRINLEKLIGGIMGMMNPSEDPFPASLNAEEQALFGLGYYHQRSEFFRKSEVAPALEEA